MNSSSASNTPAAHSYTWARQHLPELHTGVCVALHLGATDSGLAWGSGPQPAETAGLPLGLQALADRFFPAGRMSLLAAEEAIAQVEDIVMPWHGHWPTSASLITCDPHITALATWAGMPGDGPWLLSIDAVEHLFNRWAARVQGRPASQDDLPVTGLFAATLLTLREWLHHLGFQGVIVCRPLEPEVKSLAEPARVHQTQRK